MIDLLLGLLAVKKLLRERHRDRQFLPWSSQVLSGRKFWSEFFAKLIEHFCAYMYLRLPRADHSDLGIIGKIFSSSRSWVSMMPILVKSDDVRSGRAVMGSTGVNGSSFHALASFLASNLSTSDFLWQASVSTNLVLVLSCVSISQLWMKSALNFLGILTFFCNNVLNCYLAVQHPLRSVTNIQADQMQALDTLTAIYSIFSCLTAADNYSWAIRHLN